MEHHSTESYVLKPYTIQSFQRIRVFTVPESGAEGIGFMQFSRIGIGSSGLQGFGVYSAEFGLGVSGSQIGSAVA